MNNNGNKKYSKYEEVIIKTILANQIFEKNFFNDAETINWREEVNTLYNKEDFDGDTLLAQFILNSSFDNNKEYKTENFIPTNITNEVDFTMDKKFASKNEENKLFTEEEVFNEDSHNNKKLEEDMIGDFSKDII